MDMLIREMEQIGNDLPLLKAKLSELTDLACAAAKEDFSEKISPKTKHKSSEYVGKEDFLKLPDLPFPEDYLEAKKMLADFIEKRLKNPVWCTIFERVWEKSSNTLVLPRIEELNLLFS